MNLLHQFKRNLKRDIFKSDPQVEFAVSSNINQWTIPQIYVNNILPSNYAERLLCYAMRTSHRYLRWCNIHFHKSTPGIQ